MVIDSLNKSIPIDAKTYHGFKVMSYELKDSSDFYAAADESGIAWLSERDFEDHLFYRWKHETKDGKKYQELMNDPSEFHKSIISQLYSGEFKKWKEERVCMLTTIDDNWIYTIKLQ